MGRVAAASAQRQEAKELGAAHQQKRDMQGCAGLQHAEGVGSSVCACEPTPQMYRCVVAALLCRVV